MSYGFPVPEFDKLEVDERYQKVLAFLRTMEIRPKESFIRLKYRILEECILRSIHIKTIDAERDLLRAIEMVDSAPESGAGDGNDVIKLQTMLELARTYLENGGVEGIVEKCLTKLAM